MSEVEARRIVPLCYAASLLANSGAGCGNRTHFVSLKRPVWPAERNPKNSWDATKGTHNQERNSLCPLKVFHPSSRLVSGINTLFCSIDIRCKNGDLSAMRVSGDL